tara:strand:+ start:3631 stop:3831 length:201 start_codon:yes stop_codon:yes gene_type:complete
MNPVLERVNWLLTLGIACIQPKAVDTPMLSDINPAIDKGKDSSAKKISETTKQVIGYSQSFLNGKL